MEPVHHRSLWSGSSSAHRDALMRAPTPNFRDTGLLDEFHTHAGTLADDVECVLVRCF
jgi:hypothetical protein